MKWLAALLLLACTGCSSFTYALTPAWVHFAFHPPPKPPTVADEPGDFTGRFVTKDELLQVLDGRAAKVPMLHCPSLEVTADLGKDGTHDLRGLVVAQAPRSLRLYAKSERTFEIGSNNDLYWFFNNASEDRAYFGRWKHFGKACVQRLAMNPTQVMDLLGVFPVRESPQGPFLTLCYSPPEPIAKDKPELGIRPDTGCYLLEYQRWIDPARPARGRYVERIVTISTGKLKPYRWVFFDPLGRQVLRASADTTKFHEADGKMIPLVLQVTLPRYADKASLVAEREDLLEFRLGEPVFDTSKFKRPELFPMNFDPQRVVAPFVEPESWVFLDADCEREP